MTGKPFRTSATVMKVDEELGLVMGFAIVCKDKGIPYYDLQGDHIPEDAMLKAATDFMAHSQVAKEMHRGDQIGTVLFCWPMTEEIAKAFGVSVEKTGLMIAMRPSDPAMLDKFRSGKLTGFSIGGERVVDEAA